jgi:NAD+ kinase
MSGAVPVAPARALTIFSHNRVEDVAEPLRRVIEIAGESGAEVRLPHEEATKHGIEPRDGVLVGAEPDGDTDLALVLGGDGTILATLSLFAGRDVPVFAVNFGAIGFLATVEPSELDDGVRRALAGDFDVMRLPALSAATAGGDEMAVNDVSFHRRHNGRVAEIAYSVEGEELGMVRCDGLVVSTPAGSTGYNLANGGPVLAWGVEGFVVSFIAPHTLTARSLVVAPSDTLEVTNRSLAEGLDMTTDGRACHPLAPAASIEIRFEHSRAMLAQAPGATFYHRLRDKFGRLAY